MAAESGPGSTISHPISNHGGTPPTSLGPCDPSWLAKVSASLGGNPAKAVSPLLLSIWPGPTLPAVCLREACAFLMKCDGAASMVSVDAAVRTALQERHMPVGAGFSVQACVSSDCHFAVSVDSKGETYVKLDKASIPAPAVASLYLQHDGHGMLTAERAVYHAAVHLTWPQALVNDDQYLCCQVADLLLSDLPLPPFHHKLPRHTMHLTDVGGYLRQRSNRDDRLSLIFPKGQVAKARRPRLSEFLSKEELRPFFTVRESDLRESEKVVTLNTDMLLRSLGPLTGLLQKVLMPSPASSSGTPAPEAAWSASDTIGPGSACSLMYTALGAGTGGPEQCASSSTPLHPLGGVPEFSEPLGDHTSNSGLLSPHSGPARYRSAFPPVSEQLALKTHVAAERDDSEDSADSVITPVAAATIPSAPLDTPGVIGGPAQSTRTRASQAAAQQPPDTATQASSDRELNANMHGAVGTPWNASPHWPSQQLAGDSDSLAGRSATLFGGPSSIWGPPDSVSVSLNNLPAKGFAKPSSVHSEGGQLNAGGSMPASVQGWDPFGWELTATDSGIGLHAQTPNNVPNYAAALLSPSSESAPKETPSTSNPVLPITHQAPNPRAARPQAMQQYLDSAARELLGLLPAPWNEAALTTAANEAAASTADSRISRAELNNAFLSTVNALISTEPELSNLLDKASAATVRQLMLRGEAAGPSLLASVPGAAQLKPAVRKEIQVMLDEYPSVLKPEHFDAGVVTQLAKRSEAAAISILRLVAQRSDFRTVSNMPSFLTHWLLRMGNETGENGRGHAPAAEGRAGGKVATASASVRGNTKPDLRRLPRPVQAAIESLVATSPWVEWHHFDPGVLKVLQQLATSFEQDALVEIRSIEASELSTVVNMSAYLNKCFNNRLWKIRH